MKVPHSKPKLFVLFILIFSIANCQDSNKIDSLISLKKSAKTKLDKIKPLTEIIDYYYRKDPSKVLPFIKELENLNRNGDCAVCSQNAWFYYGNYYEDNLEIEKAEEYYDKAAKLAFELKDYENYFNYNIYKIEMLFTDIDNTKINIDVLTELENEKKKLGYISPLIDIKINFIKGGYYYNKTFLFTSTHHYLEVIKIANDFNLDKKYIGFAYNNISRNYRELGNFERALHYVNLSHSFAVKDNNTKEKWVTNLNKGIIYTISDSTRKAIPLLNESYIYFNNSNFIEYTASSALFLGISYKKQNDLRNSTKYFQISKDIYEKYEQNTFLGETLSYMASNNLAENKIDEAKKNILNAERILEPYKDHPIYMTFLEYKIQYLQKVGDFETALFTSQELSEYKKQIDKNTSRNLTMDLEAKYQTEQKEQQIKLLSAENELNEERRKNQLMIFGVLAALLLIGGFSVFYSYRNKIKTAEKIKELNEMKSRFFANISHEFRTPLTLIKSPLQNLQKNISDPFQTKDLNLIDQNSNRILELIDQLLELSKIDSGNLRLILKEGNLKLFLNTIVDPFLYKAKQENINFESNNNLNDSLYIYDKDVLQKIISNLLSNALKYTPEGEKISFTSEIGNENLNLVVSNSGSTIKDYEFKKLFERFHQQNSENEGFGIGLALVKDLVNVYGGKITAKNEGNILSFHVELPLHKSVTDSILIDSKNQGDEFTTEIENAEPFESDEKPILLVVDDNHDIRNLIKTIFVDQFEVLDAADAESALEISKNTIPDCIISDVMMPGMDGFEFTQIIKTNELTSFIPVILLTAKSSDEDRLESLKSEADKFIIKPFKNEILIESVHQLLKERKTLRNRYSKELILKPIDIAVNTYDEKFLDKIYAVFEENFTNPDFSVDEFSAQMGLSRMQLHRKLKSLLNVSTTEFIRNERVKTAAEMMKKGHKNISEIAYTVGFNNLSYFNKCFKQVFDETPTEYISKL